MMAVVIKDNGKIISLMVKACFVGLTGESMKDTMLKGVNMEMVR